jgi:hypothetical protein
VLNNLGAKYVTSAQGALMTKAISSLGTDAVASLSVEIIKAMELVNNQPKH